MVDIQSKLSQAREARQSLQRRQPVVPVWCDGQRQSRNMERDGFTVGGGQVGRIILRLSESFRDPTQFFNSQQRDKRHSGSLKNMPRICLNGKFLAYIVPFPSLTT